MTEIEVWGIEYISMIDPTFAALSKPDQLGENLFTSGRLDSMALMNMFLDAEVKFNFMFTAEAFQDRRLSTVSGLSSVVSELKSED